MNVITSPKFTLVLYITIDNDILMVLNQIVSIVVYANYKHINWAVILPEKQKTILKVLRDLFSVCGTIVKY